MSITTVNSSAGVYISTDDRSQSITAKKQVSKGVIVLFANQGPVDQLVKITKGQDEFIEVFGNPDPALGYGHYAALTALRFMPEMFVTRIHNDARFGGLKVYLPSAGTKLAMKHFDAPKMVDPYDPNKFYVDDLGFFDDVEDLFYIFGVYPSKKNADFRVSITNVREVGDTARPNTFQIQVWSKTGTRVPLETWTVSRDYQVDGFNRQQYLESVVNGRSKYIRVMNNPNNKTVMTKSLMPQGALLKAMVPADPLAVPPVVGSAAVYDVAPLQYLEYVAPTAEIVADPLAVPPVVGVPANPGVPNNTYSFLTAGHNGNTASISSTDAIPENTIPVLYLGQADTFPAGIVDPPIENKRSGWQVYADREDVKYDLLINGGVCIPTVQERMLEIADERGDVFVILDMPLDAQGDRYNPTARAISYRNDPYQTGDENPPHSPDTANGAMYTPWIEVFDKFTGRNIVVPPSGHIAAIYCKTDIDYAQWFAPAGLKRGLLEEADPNFSRATMTYHQADRDAFEANQINCTRTIQGIGTAIWGASTLQKMPSALSNVNVVRLLKFCTRNIDDQLVYSVFDPNDPFLRSEIVHRLNDILEPIKLNRGLYNYLVICTGPDEDNANNTYDDIANGVLHVDVYLEPVIPAKRIFVKLIVNKAGAVIGPVTTL